MLRLTRIRPLPRLLSTPATYTSSSTFTIATRSMSSRPLHIAPTPEEEGAILENEVATIEEWWKSPRWKGIKRPYSARDVATKRGTLEQSYPSSTMAKKLYSLLADKAEKGLPVHTSMSPLSINWEYLKWALTEAVRFSGRN